MRPIAFGVFFTSGASAVLFSFLIGAAVATWLSHFTILRLPFVGELQTWRLTLLASGLFGFVLLPFVSVFLRDPERHSRKRLKPTAGATGLWRYLVTEWRVCLAILVGVPIINAGIYTFLNWMTVFFFRVHHWSTGQAGVSFALTCGAAALVGSVLVGNIPRWLAARSVRAPVLTACVTAGVAVNGLGALAMLASNAWLCLALLSVAFLGFMGASVLSMSMISDVVPTEFRATFTGLTIVGTGLLTGGFGPVLVGVLTQHVFTGPTGIAPALCIVWLVGLVLGGGLIASARSKYLNLTDRIRASATRLVQAGVV
jgi:MFS family permease